MMYNHRAFKKIKLQTLYEIGIDVACFSNYTKA